MQTFKSHSLLGIYKQIVPFLLHTPEEIRSPRNQKIHEIINAHIQITEPNYCFWNSDSKTRPYPIQYLKDELKAYLSCTNSLEAFSSISKFWNKLSDDNETVNSAYGHIVNSLKLTNKEYEASNPFMSTQERKDTRNNSVFTQVEWVINSFKNDKDTRQAIMFVASPYFQYQGNKDFICTLNYHFIINAYNKLDMIVNRRSQDIMLGLTFDCPWEVVLQNMILYEIRKIYPEVDLGSYYLNCNSLHLYERNFEIFKDFVNDSSHVDMKLPEISNNYFMYYDIMHNAYFDNDPFLEWLFN